MPKTYMDLKESQYNEIGENVYDKIETELPLENKNVYEQLVADISLNEIGFVIIDKGKDNDDGFKKELAVSAYKKGYLCKESSYDIFANCRKPTNQKSNYLFYIAYQYRSISEMHPFTFK